MYVVVNVATWLGCFAVYKWVCTEGSSFEIRSFHPTHSQGFTADFLFFLNIAQTETGVVNCIIKIK